jgi:hypothetical protein
VAEVVQAKPAPQSDATTHPAPAGAPAP